MASSNNSDPYGNLGFIPDASWSERWALFSDSQREGYFAEVASWPLLSVCQMEQLLQGLPPQPSTWLPTSTCLAESLPTVTRLHQDIERSVIPRAPTILEFVAWCDARQVELPGSLVAAMQERTESPARNLAPQSTVKITVPPWMPLPLQETITEVEKKGRGRPRTSAIRYESLVSESVQLLMETAERGQYLTTSEVAKEIAKRPAGHGLSHANIVRRLKGVLPLEQAKATAARHAQSIAKKRLGAS